MKILFTLLIIGFCFVLHAQTNAPTIPPQLPDSTAADWQKAFSDIGFHVSLATMSLIVLIGVPFVKAIAAYLRKAIPDSAQVNKLGLVLAHVAGDVNPTLAKLQTAANEIVVPPAIPPAVNSTPKQNP